MILPLFPIGRYIDSAIGDVTRALKANGKWARERKSERVAK